jgi:tRNA-modifying protein YgfZ
MVAMTALLDLEAALESSRSGVVAVARDDLGVLELGGADVLSYLHVVSSQHTADLRPGDATSALLLSPKGKIEFAFRLAVVEGGALLDTHAAAAHPLAERLQRFVFRYDVTVRQVAAGSGPGVTGSGAGASATAGAAGLTAVGASASAGAAGLAAVSLLGPGWGAALEPAGLPGPSEGADRATVAAGLVVHRTPLGVDLVGRSATGALEALSRAGVALAPLEAWELARIERGLPRWGDELTDDVLAEEAGLLGSHVHLDKGCYPGQETVARVHNLGQVQRRLAGLRFEGGGLPAPRTDLRTEDGRRAGQVRSVARHPELGPIGLAYVRQVVPTGSRVLAGESAGTVVDLPFRPDRPNT